MASMKHRDTYHFTVEGETEQWYFQWLENEINNNPNAKRLVKIECKKRDPLKYVKGLTIMQPIEITHVFDYESNDPDHAKRFQFIHDRMKQANKTGKMISYKSGYCNFSFELWIVLHKTDCNGHLSNRSQYLKPINNAYNEQFENLDQYKHEDNFRRVLRKLDLQDVINAVQRAQIIADKNVEYGYTPIKYKGHNYYHQNPSLLLHKSISKLLSICGLYIVEKKA
jgi:hypothetical protein